MMSVQKFKKNGIIISHKHNPINQKSSRRKQRSIESDYWSVHRAWQLDCKRFITNRGDIISAGLSGLSIESVTYRDNQALLWLLQIKIGAARRPLHVSVGTMFEISQYIFIKEPTHNVAEKSLTAHERFLFSWSPPERRSPWFSVNLMFYLNLCRNLSNLGSTRTHGSRKLGE
ncbi:hypothetical protein CSKR_106905 [Clonorchis sinensis]|uniref:Uncharacterized protein n=1 Tax=Clonorchis sinensis TaxID=79923 RepID=A0A419Q1M9_CLOSI|nr:hypothetical protein CSKR_106905 [Clonorchis sinensis]